MIRHRQTKFALRDEIGNIVKRGNCYPATIACLLEMDVEDVPNIETLYHLDYDFPDAVMEKFLNSYGFTLNKMALDYIVFHEHGSIDKECEYLTCHKDEIENSSTADNLKNKLQDELYIVSGESKRGFKHVCIYQNGKMVWDCHPSSDGLINVRGIYKLEAYNSKKTYS